MTYVLNNHDKEGQLNTEGLVGVSGACDIVSGDIGAHDFEDTRLNVGVRYSLNVTVPHALVPNLKGLRAIARVGKQIG